MGSAVNGLLVNNEHMNIIANNISNASTIGYKSSKPVFFDIFSHSCESKGTCGHGVGIFSVINNFDDGTLIETNRNLDLAIARNGFFRLVDANNNVHYTRDGQFLLDKNENIVNMQGMYLTGQNQFYATNRFNEICNVQPINLKNAYILKEKPTSEIYLKTILNSNRDSISTNDNYDGKISNPFDYHAQIDIYDKNGQLEKLNIYFNKQDENTWKVNLESNNIDNNSNEKSINKSFDLKFNTDGELISEKIFNIQSSNSKYEDITLDLTGTTEQSSIDNDIINYSQNGYSSGHLETFNVIPNGEIIATYSNMQTQPIGQILLSTFVNPEKLQYESGNLWSATEAAGPEKIGIAGDPGFGVLNAKALEASNVDLNKELINMMIAQRNYQSNAQSFKAEEKAISTLINDLR